MGTNAERFLDLFKGFKEAHGQTEVLNYQRNGKQKAKSFIVREPLTIALVEQHLEGKQGVGSIPIDETNGCTFGALDIDDYNLDLVALCKKSARFKLPLTVCRSKSGGAHLFIFLSEKVPAVDLRDKLAEFASALGFGTCEIFPKQEEVIVERGDVGNFINLPYFQEEYTTRFAYDDNGKELSLEEFLVQAENAKISLKDLRAFELGTNSEVLPNGPPCLQQLTEHGIPEGGRNNTLLNIGVFYKMSSPNNWRDLLEKHNQNHCSPSLPAKEIVTIQEQLEKKEYFYTCKQEPIQSHCNKSLCRTRQFGVGGKQDCPTIGGLTVVESEPAVWFVDVDGSRLELSTKQLQMQMDFQRACMEQMYQMPAKMKETDWREMINALLQTATRINVPEELTTKGQFNELLEMFCTSRIKAQSEEELLTGKPWTSDRYTYFKLGALQEFLRRKGFTNYSRGQITERLKELNNGQVAFKRYRLKDNKDAWREVRVWFVPEMEELDVDLEAPSFQEKTDMDVPF
jgi:hypothetical protein